jgi:CAAX prenyl protease N-terminal, five membrane helices
VPPLAVIAFVLILARGIAELWLSRLNQRYVRAHANEVPSAFRAMVDEATYRRSVDYTMRRSRFGDVVTVFDAVLLVAILFSGVLPWAFGKFTAAFGTSVLAVAGFLFITGVVLSIANLPFAWYAQFRLEERFGFNTTTLKTWVTDRMKGLSLAVLLGYRVDRAKLVGLGSGGRHRLSIIFAAHRPRGDHAAIQQIHSPSGRILARSALCIGAARRLSDAQHRRNGRQQTLPALQRFLHRVRSFSQNSVL